MPNDTMVAVEKTGPKTISITFPPGTRARLKSSVSVAELLAVLKDESGIQQQSPVMLTKPDPV